MLKKLINWLFAKEQPIWAHGLECQICKMTFVSAKAHKDHVVGDFQLHGKHKGKIPVLRCK